MIYIVNISNILKNLSNKKRLILTIFLCRTTSLVNSYIQEVVVPFTIRIDVSLFSIKITIPLNKYFGLKFVCVKSKTFSNQMKDKSC